MTRNFDGVGNRVERLIGAVDEVAAGFVFRRR